MTPAGSIQGRVHGQPYLVPGGATQTARQRLAPAQHGSSAQVPRAHLIRRLRAIEGLVQSALRALEDAQQAHRWQRRAASERAFRCLRRADAIARSLPSTIGGGPLPSFDPSSLWSDEGGDSSASVRAHLLSVRDELAARRDEVERRAPDSLWNDAARTADAANDDGAPVQNVRSLLVGGGADLGWWVGYGSVLALWALSGLL